ncbi:SHOCT domain-containing protein [Allonocardiopsis opalescens]|uniref:Putative oligomerization/nucleic acid binding protein n=1 Tax=Allonocardiopsis opalescens TaxID=1144618 RepID=A0A2T0PPL6_9ACTN|nr:PH domain-containing protein [Allonocardiopsis opalescens]PRX90842.1 putative oligomerization/nucleic acid binding protein [Allonocardiopsis opalescens]
MATEALRPDIQAARDRMTTRLGSNREIRRLVEHLWDGETVERLAAGSYGGGTGLLVLTGRRLLFIRDGWTGQVSEDFPFEKISSVQWAGGLLLGKLVVFASGNKAEIGQLDKTDGRAIADAVRGRLSGGSAPAAPAPQAPAAAAAADDVYEALRKLGELRDAGIVTADEFDAKKAELLRRV